MPEESKEELEKRKLIAEIKNLNRPPFRTPTFWTPVITLLLAITTYIWFASNGLFDYKQAHIAFITDTLTKRAKFLDAFNKDLDNEKNKQILEIKNIRDSISKIRDSIGIYRTTLQQTRGSMTEQQKQIADLKIKIEAKTREAEYSQAQAIGKANALYGLSTDVDYLGASNKKLTALVDGYKRHLVIILKMYEDIDTRVVKGEKGDDLDRAMTKLGHFISSLGGNEAFALSKTD